MFRETRYPTLALLLLLGSGEPQKKGASPEEALKKAPKALQTILVEDLRRHVRKLASAEFEGRRTGTPGQVRAAEYFRDHFKKLGLKPWGDKARGRKRGWYQEY